MSSEVKLIVQNNVTIDSEGNFKLSFAENGYNGKQELVLSAEDEFFFKSFLVNIDTRDKNQTDYIEENNEIDLTQGEIKFIKENMEKSKDEYENSSSNLKVVEIKLNASNYIQWKEVIPHQLTFHMKFKQNVFGLETFDMSSNYVLNLVRQPNSDLSYKDKTENVFGKSKYSFAKAFSSSGTIHFYHHQCELKIINNVTTSIRFLKQNIHDKNDFGAKFAIHVIPEPRPSKHYLYFDFFDFYNYYQIHKESHNLDVGGTFHSYLTDNETEIFTTFEKFQNTYQNKLDYRFYFLVDQGGRVTTLKYPNTINYYILETFIKVLEKEQIQSERSFS